MKTFWKLTPLLFSIVIVGCSKSSEEKILDSLNLFAAPDVVDSIQVLDTISVAEV